MEELVREAVGLLRDGVTLSTNTWLFLLGATTLGAFLGAYLKTMGQHLATKMDIEELTEKVEKVRLAFDVQREELRHHFAKQLEEHAQQNRLKLAALTERLVVHQEAYARVRKMTEMILANDLGEIAKLCGDSEEWFHQHCLYLTEESRDAVQAALLCSRIVQDPNRGELDPEEFGFMLQEAFNARRILLQSVGFAGLSEAEERTHREVTTS